MTTDKLNRPLRDLRISVTDRCNFRCHYCMPEEIFGQKYQFLARAKILTFEEVTRLVGLFAQLGVRKLRLTGGEPLLRHSIDNLIAMLACVTGIEDIALTTNGYHLGSLAAKLRSAGLHRLTISLDTLKPDRLKKMAGTHLELERVLDGIAAAEEAGFGPIKINSVIHKGINDDEIVDLVRFAKTHGHIIRFIEYMDVGTLNHWQPQDVISAAEIVDRVNSEIAIEPIAKNYASEVASRYRFLDGEGELGIIASVSHPFCGACSRIRLSADGKLYTCLFASKGVDVRQPLRTEESDQAILDLLRSIWADRTDRYSEERSELRKSQTSDAEKVEMYHIGG